MGRLKYAIGAFIIGGLVLVFLAVAGLLFARQDFDKNATRNRRLPPTVGSVVPDFELADTDGGLQTLSSYRGKRVLINFWATWCPPCKEEMPLLQQYGQKYAGTLVILGINSGEEPEIASPVIAEMGITFPILLDQAGEITDLYFVKDFPYTFFVDEAGILRGQHIGLLSEEQLVRYLKTIGIEP
jgi:thiol-disulfide isomerase/thioredoxin